MSEWASSKTESLFLWRINQCLNTESTLQKRPLPFPTQKISFWFFQVGLWSAPNINGVLNRHLTIFATDQAVIRRERGQGKAAGHTQKATSFVGTSMNSRLLSNTIVSWPHLQLLPRIQYTVFCAYTKLSWPSLRKRTLLTHLCILSTQNISLWN